MIENENQRMVTEYWLDIFKRDLQHVEAQLALKLGKRTRLFAEIHAGALRSHIEEFEADLKAYKERVDGDDLPPPSQSVD